ncbi:MAG TPA: cell division protein SepF [Sedimentibacter sp.]|nr:cell division protein SepF [Sedimentibacter sp.]HOA19667.1 cell division protein SepF [Sedimentibacter sp.]HOG62133.1 cell division protein SepF [Sedimentibacter sp.]HQC69628.1 cell division protein SepF [Sedimentibacter sp.]HQK53321.1 cell division protein SepF [Sedimentibacter sp.]
MSMMEKVKDFIGITDLEEDYEEEDLVSEGTERNKNERMGTNTKRNNVIKVHSNTDMKVFICEPEKYEDCTKAVDEIKNRKVVVLNIEGMELEDQKQVFEFIKGAIYALEASIQKVSNGIFVLAPNNVQIDGRLSDRYERNYYYGK